MKILISCVPFDRGKSGISVYIRNLVSELQKAGHSLTLIVEPGAEEFFPGCDLKVLPVWTKNPFFSMFYHLFILPFFLPFRKWELCIIAAANRRTFCFYPRRTICVVHDLAQYHIEAKYDRFRTLYLKTLLPFFIRFAPQVAAISRSTESDLIKYWKIRPDKITVCLNGLSLQEECESGWAKRFELENGNYILYVSRIEHPGKNHLNLIKAYEMLPETLRRKYVLVIAGADWHGAEEVHNYADGSSVADRIIFSGFVQNNELYEAYKYASCYVFPSFFEGFGLSLIEAMHYGIPCCCSNNSSLGEIGENAALLFSPDNPEAIAQSLEKILTDNALREKLIKAGHERSAMFSWRDHAKKIVEIYKNA